MPCQHEAWGDLPYLDELGDLLTKAARVSIHTMGMQTKRHGVEEARTITWLTYYLALREVPGWWWWWWWSGCVSTKK